MMTWLEALVLGLIQGLTEFLPVSSSGHLQIFSTLFGILWLLWVFSLKIMWKPSSVPDCWSWELLF